jgi:FkbM family methyltransferase
MSRSLAARAIGLLSDCCLSLSSRGPSIHKTFDREYMAAWHQFSAFDQKSVKSLMDIGAHDGLFASRASRYFELSRTILVEPLPEKLESLRQMRLPDLTVVPAALAASVGTATFTINATDQASSLKRVNPQSGGDYGLDLSEVMTIDAEVTTMDQLFVDLGLSSVDLVKIDVQGAERDLLQGAQASLPRIHFIQIEALFTEHYAQAADFCELHEILTSAGFRLLRLIDPVNSSSGVLLQCDAIYQNEQFNSARASTPV